jgi:hypothetical protein
MKKSTLSFAVSISLMIFLVGCDKGKNTLNGLMKSEGAVLDQDLNEDNIGSAYTLAMGLKLIAAAHANEGSGKIAKEKLNFLREKATTRRNQLIAEIEQHNKSLEEPLVEIFARAIQLQTEIKSNKRRETTFKEGDCVASKEGSEFAKDPALFHIKVVKIEKVGEQEFLIKTILDPNADDVKYPTKSLEKISKIEAKPESKFMLSGGMKINCDRAEKLAAQYRVILQNFIPQEKISAQMLKIGTILSDGYL